MDSRNGFTLIEILIVLAISAMLMSIAITYSGTERDQIALSVEETKISQFVLQARSLALATYNNSSVHACGYGMIFDSAQNTYSVFAYTPPATATSTCPPEKELNWGSISSSANENQYTGTTWQIQPGSNITFTTSGGLGRSIVLFYPPNPDTFIFNSDGSQASSLSIFLTGAGGESAPPITIDQTGQVNIGPQ
jgi:prepilin-type N-terminal cleavage/methylation domain-containing protein